jgi:hypothetical protein
MSVDNMTFLTHYLQHACIHEQKYIRTYVEINQLNSLKLYNSLFFFYDGSYMFRQNNAILRERLCSFLSQFRVNMVGDKSQDIWRNVHTGVLYCELSRYTTKGMHLVVYLLCSLYSTPVCRFRHMSCDLSPTVLTLKCLRKVHSRSLRMALFCAI